MKYYISKILVPLWTLLGGPLASGNPEPIRELEPARRDAFRAVARNDKLTSRPPPEAFALEDRLGVSIPLESVRPEIVDEAVRWMKEFMRPEWLPADLKAHLIARKDARLYELRLPDGTLDSVQSADLLIADYEIDEQRFILCETGGSLTVRIHLLEEWDFSQGAEKRYLELVSRYLNIKANVQPDDIKVVRHGSVLAFQKRNPPSPREAMERARSGTREWGGILPGQTDGRVFIITLPKNAIEPKGPVARLGLPDRF